MTERWCLTSHANARIHLLLVSKCRRVTRSTSERGRCTTPPTRSTSKDVWPIKPVTVVSILNFKFNHCEEWPKEHYRSSYRLHEDTYKEVMTDAIRFVFLELGRFNKYIWELETTFDKWMYLLKHMHEIVEIPKELEDSRFKRLFLLAEIDNFIDEERKQYEESLKNMGDYINIINTATEEAEKRGFARGIDVGREEGRIQSNVVVVKNLHSMGMSHEDISKIVELTKEMVETIEKAQ